MNPLKQDYESMVYAFGADRFPDIPLAMRLRWAEEHCEALWLHRHDHAKLAAGVGFVVGFVLALVIR